MSRHQLDFLCMLTKNLISLMIICWIGWIISRATCQLATYQPSNLLEGQTLYSANTSPLPNNLSFYPPSSKTQARDSLVDRVRVGSAQEGGEKRTPEGASCSDTLAAYGSRLQISAGDQIVKMSVFQFSGGEKQPLPASGCRLVGRDAPLVWGRSQGQQTGGSQYYPTFSVFG